MVQDRVQFIILLCLTLLIRNLYLAYFTGKPIAWGLSLLQPGGGFTDG